jgi:hypothetical protein
MVSKTTSWPKNEAERPQLGAGKIRLEGAPFFAYRILLSSGLHKIALTTPVKQQASVKTRNAWAHGPRIQKRTRPGSEDKATALSRLSAFDSKTAVAKPSLLLDRASNLRKHVVGVRTD